VPQAIQRSINFPIYYPVQAKLPNGYELIKNSFTTPASDVVLYTVKYPAGKFIFSQQQRPSSNDIANFESQRIPIHYTMATPIGQAAVGVIGGQTIISLPTSNSWLLITGPQLARQKDILAVLNSLTK
jgi:hypothetical protein